MAIIPARISSTRLKNKPLQLINGTPLIKHVAESVLKTKLFDRVYVATDSEDIKSLFDGGEVCVVMTDPAHESGTDRICEVIDSQNLDVDVVFNIQGDEPFVYQADLEKLKQVMAEGAQMASLYEKIEPEDLDNINKVKVILNDSRESIYFSRFRIPFSRERGDLKVDYIGKHIGVYAYKKDFLKDFCKRGVGYHEAFEKLEQLRALEMGVKLKMVYTENSYMGVDTEEDLKRVNEILKA